jgi:hypothetical protein
VYDVYEQPTIRFELARQRQADLLADARDAQLRPDLDHLEPGPVELAQGLSAWLRKFLGRQVSKPELQSIRVR